LRAPLAHSIEKARTPSKKAGKVGLAGAATRDFCQEPGFSREKTATLPAKSGLLKKFRKKLAFIRDPCYN